MIRLLNILGNQIEIDQQGTEGTPIIILTGMGCSFYEWTEIAEIVSKTNRVIMVHRPGLGQSQIQEEVRNTKRVVEELEGLINKLELTEPILFIGHSYGGLCVQHFAKVHPEKVAGIILVDSTSVNLRELDELHLPVLDEGESDEDWMEKCKSYSLMDLKQLRAFINPTLSEKQKSLPPDIQELIINFSVNPTLYKAMHSEIKYWKKDADVIKTVGAFPDVPLIVIGRDKEYCIRMGIEQGLPEWELRLLEEKWQELILEQATYSKYSEILFAEGSSHSIHMDRPDVIIESIYKVTNLISNSL